MLSRVFIARNTRRFADHNRRCFSQKPPSSTDSSGATGSTRGPVTFLSLAICAAAGGAFLTYYNIEKEKRMEQVVSEVVSTGKPALGGPFVLVDENGVPRTDASYRGKYVMLYFGFTYCPDICPSELVKVGKIMEGLAKKGISEDQVKPVFVSVDPNRDTIGQIRHYGKDFHKSMTFLTGTKEQVGAVAKAYRVYFSKANENDYNDEDYLVDHSIVIYFLGPDGEFLDFFTQRTQVGDVVEKIAKEINGAAGDKKKK